MAYDWHNDLADSIQAHKLVFAPYYRYKKRYVFAMAEPLPLQYLMVDTVAIDERDVMYYIEEKVDFRGTVEGNIILEFHNKTGIKALLEKEPLGDNHLLAYCYVKSSCILVFRIKALQEWYYSNRDSLPTPFDMPNLNHVVAVPISRIPEELYEKVDVEIPEIMRKKIRNC